MHEVLTARAYVLMHTYDASENQDLGSHKIVQVKKYCWEHVLLRKLIHSVTSTKRNID